jgi:release factor glutamine methyltransferase
MQIKEYLSSNIIDIKELLTLVLEQNITWVYTNLEYELTPVENTKLQNLIKQRKNGRPFAYLRGNQGFYHLDFVVDENTLIPRPETENIIEIIKGLNLKQAKILDLGTGSGAIAITLKDLFPNYDITAIDNNSKTLLVAKKNAKNHNLNINFILSNWFENITGKFDIIISNPPYIDKNSHYLDKLKFEPQKALVADDSGLSDIKTIVKNAPKYLNLGGYLLLEHGFDQREDIIDLLTSFSEVQVFNDLNGVHRNILAKL